MDDAYGVCPRGLEDESSFCDSLSSERIFFVNGRNLMAFERWHMRTIEMNDGVVVMIDQRKLPRQFERVECRDYHAVIRAIKDMTVRGAPAIGAAAAFGLALAARESQATTRDALLVDLDQAARELRATRPTAVNLGWALDRLMGHGEDRWRGREHAARRDRRGSAADSRGGR